MKLNLHNCNINWERIEYNMETLFRKHNLAICNLITEDNFWYSISIIKMNTKGVKKLRIMSGHGTDNVVKRDTIIASFGTLKSILRLQLSCELYKYISIHPITKTKNLC